MSDDWLAFRDLAGGVLGGFAASLMENHPRVLRIFAKCVVGGLTAAFLAPAFRPLLGPPWADAANYLVGLAGYAICHAAIAKMTALIGGTDVE